MTLDFLAARPIVVAIGGPNGAGKSTFFEAHLTTAGLRFVNADDIARALGIDAYEAAAVADALRRSMIASRESFVFETVLSDRVGAKLEFLREAVDTGYTVVLLFVGIADVATSIQRVSMRASQGGHDVPDDKLADRFARTLENLRGALRRLPHVVVYDNTDLRRPYRRIAVYEDGEPREEADPLPEWFARVRPRR